MLRVLLVVLVMLVARVAFAADEEPVDAALQRLGCESSQVLALGERWYAACGARGVFVMARREGNLELVERRRVPGSARAVYARDEQVWVESTHVEARPLVDLAVEGAAAAQAPGRVEAPSRSSAEQQLESKLFPSRMGGYLALEGSLRPLLPIDTRAFALIAELSLSYVGEHHWFAELRGFPLGGIIGQGRDTPLLGALAQVGYDHPYFAIGVGAGALTRGSWREQYTSDGDRSYAEQTTRVAITQFGRLGARDGLNLSTQGVFVLVDKWRFGFVEVRTQIPIVRGVWLTPAGAGGAEAGFFYAEVGLRKQLYGDRGHASLFLRPSVGAAGVDKRDKYNAMRAGPMVGFHVEWRK